MFGIPILTIAKWAGAVLLAGTLVTGFFIVKGWHDDSLALPQVTAQRDQAQADYKALDDTMVNKFDGIAARLYAIEKNYRDLEGALTGDSTAIAASLAKFKKDTAYASSILVPGSPDDLAVRRGLLDLLVLPISAEPTAPSGGIESGQGIGLPPAADPASDLPGRQRTGVDRQGLFMPGPGDADRCHQGRTAQGCGGRSHRLGAAGNRRTVSAARLGQAMPRAAWRDTKALNEVAVRADAG